MAQYVDLGTPGPNLAGPDQTGRNPGNLTNALTAAFINVQVSVFECYRMTVNSVPLGAAAIIQRNQRQFSFVQPFSGSTWSPPQPLLLRFGDEIYFLWNVVSSSTPLPVVTAFFRYDASLVVNMGG